MKRLHQLYRHFDSEDNLLYIGISINAVNRLSGHQKISSWYKNIAQMKIENYPTRQELEESEIKAIQDENPLHNIIRYNGEQGKFEGDGYTIEEQAQLEKIIIQQCRLARTRMMSLFKKAKKGDKASLDRIINIITRRDNEQGK